MLPIHDIQDRLLAALDTGNRVVLSAPTGSGKTTQVPQMLFRSGLVKGQVIVLQPRRLAARLVAARVASEMNVPLGQEVGYQTRHDSRISNKTVIRFMTEGLFVRLLQSTPTLPGVGAVIFDEFHERNLPADVSLAMTRALQNASRPDLKLIVMSATLDVAKVSRYVDGPSLEAGGRAFPVDIHYLEKRGTNPPWELAADALEHVLELNENGDVLIFMPGAFEIRRTLDACRRVVRASDRVALLPLHGEMPPHEQDATLTPRAERRVIVSTNIAETSITIPGDPGVRHVIDSGLARVNRFDPRRGLNALLIEPISQASAEQRAGRAGRTAPGTCWRLWPKNEHRTRPAQTAPEVQRLDLAEVLLQLLSMGVADPAAFAWLEPPEPLALAQAMSVLRLLGATDDAGRITPRGRAMATLPMHPRLAAMLIEARRRGCLERAALWAAFISERDILMRNASPRFTDFANAQPIRSDFLVLEAAFDEAARMNFDAMRCANLGVNANACRELDRTRKLFVEAAGRSPSPSESSSVRERVAAKPPGEGAGVPVRLVSSPKAHVEPRPHPGPLPEEEGVSPLILCLLSAFPDHVAVRRGEGNLACAVVGNRRGNLDPGTVAKRVGLVLPVEVSELGTGTQRDVKTVLSLVSEIEPAWLRELFPQRVVERHVTRWNPDQQCVERVEQHAFDDLVFDETARPETDLNAAAQVLADQLNPASGGGGGGTLKLEQWDESVEQWIARVRCVAHWFPERKLITYAPDELRLVVEEIVAGAVRYSQVKDRPCLAKLKDALSWDDQQFVEKMAPDRLALPAGWKMKIEYPPDPTTGASPRGKAKIQDFYGLNHTPTVAAGRVKLTLEILGPNRRPVQLTDDLPGFWKNLYPVLKKELARKYPRHEWR